MSVSTPTSGIGVQASGGVMPWGGQGVSEGKEYPTMQVMTNPHANPQVENILASCDVSFVLEEINVDEIKRIKQFQVREVLDPLGAYEGEFSKKIVEEYSDSLNRGDKFPAIVVRQADHGYDMVEGRHRFYAHKSAGVEKIWAYVVPGHVSDQACRTLACVLNDIHGHANSDGDRKKVSLENAVNAYLQALVVSKRDPAKLIVEMAREYRVNETTLRGRIRAKQAKSRIVDVGENPELITDTIANQLHSLIAQASDEDVKKLTQTVGKAREHGLSSERILLAIRDANLREKTSEQLIKDLQTEADLDDHNRKLRAGEAEVLRRTDLMIANLEAAKQSLKRQVTSYRLTPEKVQQVLLCLNEIRGLAAVWTSRLCD